MITDKASPIISFIVLLCIFMKIIPRTMTWFYNLLIGIGGLLIAFLAFLDEIARKVPLLKGLSSLIVKFAIFFLAGALIVVPTIFKDADSETAVSKAQEQQ